ncbi:SRPBCC family protein [Hoeflea sp. TYP-13]|uniref:SRPBCC family protein n=1 Tax=Hoeflea sp. TYP-13 TaxID=3230023 RepID=UPI0034C6669B
MIFEVEESVDAPADAVWQCMTDTARMPRWMSGIEHMRTADGKAIGEGSTLLFVARGAERTTRVSEFEPSRRMTLISTQGPVTATYRYALTPGKNGQPPTRIVLNAACVASGWMAIFMPLLGPLIRKTDGTQLKLLKELVQDEPG